MNNKLNRENFCGHFIQECKDWDTHEKFYLTKTYQLALVQMQLSFDSK